MLQATSRPLGSPSVSSTTRVFPEELLELVDEGVEVEVEELDGLVRKYALAPAITSITTRTTTMTILPIPGPLDLGEKFDNGGCEAPLRYL